MTTSFGMTPLSGKGGWWGGGGGGGGGLPQPNNAMVATLTRPAGLLPQLQQQGANQMDLLQLGMGLGLSLQQQGLLPSNGMQQPSLEMPSTVLDESQTMQSSTSSVPIGMPLGLTGGQPIGLVDPTSSNRTAQLLDHQAEDDQRNAFAQIDPTLTTVEQYKGMAVVPTVTPDESGGHVMRVSEVSASRSPCMRIRRSF